MRTRVTPPMCMGRRMLPGIPGEGDYRLKLPEIFRSVFLVRQSTGWIWFVRSSNNAFEQSGRSSGPRAAANAAQRYLVDRAQLTIKLAGRRAA